MRLAPSLLSFVLTMSLALPAFGDRDIAKLITAFTGPDRKAAETAIVAGLKSPNPRARAIAARMANVRRMTSAIDTLLYQTDREKDVDTAKEMFRALIMVGGLRHVDRSLYISDRFSRVLDPSVVNAMAHLGAPAIDAYFSSLSSRQPNTYQFFRTALWGRPEAAAAVAARLLEKDPFEFQTFLLMARREPRMLVGTATLRGGLTHPDPAVRAATTWYLIEYAIRQRGAVDAPLRQTIGDLRVPRDNADLIAGVELLRRAIGLPKRNFAELRQAFRNVRHSFRMKTLTADVNPLLTEEERIALDRDAVSHDRQRDDLPFVMPSGLPESFAAEALEFTGCREGWAGTGKVRVDEMGYVVSSDISGVKTSAACRRALDLMLQLSIAENETISAPRESARIPFLRPASAPACFDDLHNPAIVTRRPARVSLEPPGVTGNYVRPVWPPGVPRKIVSVGIELFVSTQGCVRTARVVRPAPDPAITAAALATVQQWQFGPGFVNSVPVDMLHEVTVTFYP